MENEALKIHIDSQIGLVLSELKTVNRRLDKINGTVAQNTQKGAALETRLVAVETRCSLTTAHDQREHNRMEDLQEKNRAGIQEIFKQYGSIILTILIVLNMVGNMIGWW